MRATLSYTAATFPVVTKVIILCGVQRNPLVD